MEIPQQLVEKVLNNFEETAERRLLSSKQVDYGSYREVFAYRQAAEHARIAVSDAIAKYIKDGGYEEEI